METPREKHGPDQVFSLDGESWQIMVGGEVLPHTFNSQGAAIAGLDVEQRRVAKKAEMKEPPPWADETKNPVRFGDDDDVLNESGPRGETWL